MLNANEPHPRPSYPASSQIITIVDRRTRELASAMLRLHAEGGCTEATLLAEGYSRHELAELGDAARRLANQDFVRQVETAPLRTDDELLDIAADRCTGLFNEGQIVAALRSDLSFTLESISRIWPRLTDRLALKVRGMPAPKVLA